MTRRWAELVAAFTLLTRLPVAGLAVEHPSPAACVWAYPVVGLVVGGIGTAVLEGAMAIGMAQPLAAVWALAATVMVTGGLHEDGLADTADGFGGGRTRERKLTIMRDSRIGAFGALALGLSLVVRAVALGLAARPGWSLIAAAVLARGAMLLPLLVLSPARPDGLGASLSSINDKEPAPCARGLGRTGEVAAGDRPSHFKMGPVSMGLAITAASGLAAPRSALAALVAAAAVTFLARRHIGGYTGDVFGATEQVVECAALSL